VPNKYERRGLWGRALYEYKTLQITDYTDDTLSASNNPFAVVMLVAKEALMKLKGSDQEIDKALIDHKLMIVNLLQEKGIFSKRKINAIMTFLENYVGFKKPETNRIFRERIDQKTGKENTMGIIEQLAEIKAEEARAEALENASRLFVENLLKQSDFSQAKIASLANVSLSFVKKVKKGLSSK
jgi:predicted XRE-type DNA-binding protein